MHASPERGGAELREARGHSITHGVAGTPGTPRAVPRAAAELGTASHNSRLTEGLQE